MDLNSYFSDVLEGVEFLIALGSLIGLFGLFFGVIMLIFGGRPFKSKAIKIVLISTILVVVCCLNTGIKYFRL